MLEGSGICYEGKDTVDGCLQEVIVMFDRVGRGQAGDGLYGCTLRKT
jgi:hypothetical protein